MPSARSTTSNQRVAKVQPTIEYIIYGAAASSDIKDWLPSALSAAGTVISAIIAYWAYKFSQKQLSLQDSHNRLMVRPHLDDMIILDEADQTYCFEITNNGIGPAIIEKAVIFIDGAETATSTTIPDVIRKVFPELSSADFGHHSVAIGSYISPTEKIKLVSINCNAKIPLEEVRSRLERRTFMKVTYKSIYDERFEYDTKQIKDATSSPGD